MALHRKTIPVWEWFFYYGPPETRTQGGLRSKTLPGNRRQGFHAQVLVPSMNVLRERSEAPDGPHFVTIPIMQTICTIHESDVYSKTEDDNADSSNFSLRQAARAVVRNEQGQVALLKVNKHNYHKLPGGGVEQGENEKQALKRELLEEIGCRARIVSELGKIIEFRNKWKLKQTSYCYLTVQVGEQLAPEFTQKEKKDGFEILWVDNIESAVALLKADEPANYEGLFIQQRDIKFLEAAKNML